MPLLVLSAVFSSFLFVRLLKGPWGRNPQFLAAAMVGSVAVSLIGESLFPGAGDDMILGNLMAFAGSAAGIFLLDVLV